MKKERLKSILLIMLIITNLVLAEKILVNEKLWLSGYNFFVSTRNPKVLCKFQDAVMNAMAEQQGGIFTPSFFTTLRTF